MKETVRDWVYRFGGYESVEVRCGERRIKFSGSRGDELRLRADGKFEHHRNNGDRVLFNERGELLRRDSPDIYTAYYGMVPAVGDVYVIHV